MTAFIHALTLMCLFVAPRADTSLVTWTIEGTFQPYQNNIGGLGLAIGEPYRFELTFDSDTPEWQGDPACCSFLDAVSAMSFENGTFEASLTPGVDTSISSTDDGFAVYGRPLTLTLLDPATEASAVLPIAPPVDSATQTVSWDEVRYAVAEPAGAGLLALAELALVVALRAVSPRGKMGAETRGGPDGPESRR